MLSNVRRKMIQKNIKKYSELKVNEWWNINIGSHIFKYSNLGKQRYSKKKINKLFENPSLELFPYYKVNNEIYNLILCPSGTFRKGHKQVSDNKPQEMTIKKSFLLGETEITQEIYQSVMCENPSHFQGNPKNPVEQVSWYDAVIFCNKISDKFGLERYYTITKESKIVDTIEEEQENYVVGMNEKSKGFRLPTEWEWEYAAKARTPLEYSGSNNVDEVAWYGENSGGTTQPIKGRKPNAWGFYDMSGNVWEWCENGYDMSGNVWEGCENKYDSTSTLFITVNRGGSWFSPYTSSLYSASRGENYPSYRSVNLGFRVCKYI